MNKTIAILFAVILGATLSAQPNHKSFQSIWINSELSDSSRFMEAFVLVNDQYLYTQPDSAEILSEFMKDWAKSQGYIRFQALAIQLKGISYDIRSDFVSAIEEYEKAESLFLTIKDEEGRADLSKYIVNTYRKMEKFTNALDYANHSLSFHEKTMDSLGMAWDYLLLAAIYSSVDTDLQNTRRYSSKSLELFKKLNHKFGMARAYNSIGYVGIRIKDYDYSLKMLQQSKLLNEEIGNKQYLAYNLNNMGMIYLRMGKIDTALTLLTRSLKLKREVKDTWATVETLYSIGEIYLIQENYEEALEWCRESRITADEVAIVSRDIDICKCFYSAFKGLKRYREAVEYNDKYLELIKQRDLDNTDKQLQQMEFSKKVIADSLNQEQEKLKMQIVHDNEVRQKNRVRNIFISSGIFMLLISLALFSRLRYIRKSKATIEKEKERSEKLLLNILPFEIAEELKAKGEANARKYDMVSILFTDFKEFTQKSTLLSPVDLVKEVNYCFQSFDLICEKYQIEKIKTIGDAYMAASGVPVPSANSVKNAIMAALEMQEVIVNRKTENKLLDKIYFDMRVGVHTGPVVAGIVGVKKFQYDVWGDTVNTANRMETHGRPGKVNISQTTYELLKDDPQFQFEHRGKIDVKGKGEIDMYFVSLI